jgi:hypothetical protein
MSAHDDYLDPDRQLYNQEEPESYSDAWSVVNKLYGKDEDNRDESQIKKAVYKHTECGAWIEFEEHGIRLGSIVEGCEEGCQNYFLTWRNVTEEAITERLDAIEKEADAIWKWANENREDGQTDAETGLDFPDVRFDYRHLL